MNMFYTRADTPARVRAGLTLSSDQSTVRFTDYAHYGFDGFIKYMRLRLFSWRVLTRSLERQSLRIVSTPPYIVVDGALTLTLGGGLGADGHAPPPPPPSKRASVEALEPHHQTP